MKHFLSIFVGMLLFSSLYSADLEKISLQLKWKYQFQFAGFIAAKEKGFYKDVGLDVELLEYTQSTQMIQEMQDGKTTFGVSDSALILEALKGLDIVALMALYQESPYVFTALKSSNINTIKDLNGKKIAIYDDINGVTIESMLQINNLEFIKQPISSLMTRLKNKEIDVAMAYISNEPYTAQQMGMDITIINPNDYGFYRYGDILFTLKDTVENRPELVEKMYKASQEGFRYAFTHIDEMVDIIYEKYNTQNKSKGALLYEANVLKKMSGVGKNFGELTRSKINSIAYVYGYTESVKYNAKNLDDFIYKPKIKTEKTLQFTKEEKEYLDSIDSISMCYPINNPPYTMIKNGKVSGISFDMLSLTEELIGKKYKLIYARTTHEQFVMASNKECDTVPLILTSPQIIPFLKPTIAVGADNITLVTKIGLPYIFDIKKIYDKKIGVNKNAINVIEYIKKNYPEINYVAVDGMDLDKVQSGELYGFLGASIQLNYLVSTNYPATLKIMKTFEESKLEGSVGVHVDEPILLSILNKAIAKIDKSKQAEIFNKWLDIKYQYKTDYFLVYLVLLGSFVLLGASFYWNRRLQKEIKIRKKAEKFSLKNELRFKTLFDVAPIMIDSFDENGKCILWNKECEKVFGWTIDEINERENALALFYPDKKIQADVIASFSSKNKNMFREWHPVTKDGKTKATMWANVELENGELISIGYDFTELRDTKIKLSELNSSLENKVKIEIEKNKQHQLLMMQQSRLAQAGETISMIAHQWRHPLNNLSLIIQNTIFQYRVGKLDDSLIDTLDKQSNQQIEDMSNTIKDFRDFFKPERKKIDFNVADSIHLALSIVKPILSAENISLDFTIEDNATFNGYQNELGQSIVNILTNSKDALLENKINNGYVKISLSKESDNIFIRIKDNAGGIDDDIIEKIFDPYFSTKTEKNGTGLGLYMSKIIIEEHMGGTISVFNDKDGVNFIIKL